VQTCLRRRFVVAEPPQEGWALARRACARGWRAAGAGSTPRPGSVWAVRQALLRDDVLVRAWNNHLSAFVRGRTSAATRRSSSGLSVGGSVCTPASTRKAGELAAGGGGALVVASPADMALCRAGVAPRVLLLAGGAAAWWAGGRTAAGGELCCVVFFFAVGPRAHCNVGTYERTSPEIGIEKGRCGRENDRKLFHKAKSSCSLAPFERTACPAHVSRAPEVGARGTAPGVRRSVAQPPHRHRRRRAAAPAASAAAPQPWGTWIRTSRWVNTNGYS